MKNKQYPTLNNRYFDLHRPSVDEIINSSSRSRLLLPPTHLKSNKKREQMQEGNIQTDKYTEIERENRILLEKIHKIMRTNNHSYIPNMKKSLNANSRIKTQKKIAKENENLVKRLNEQKSKLDFPDPIRLKTDYRSKPAENYYSAHSQSVSIDRPRKLSPLNVEVKKLVFQQEIQLDGRLFNIEIMRGRKNTRIVATDVKHSNFYSIELSNDEAESFMGGADNWERLIRCLHIEGVELALIEA